MEKRSPKTFFGFYFFVMKLFCEAIFLKDFGPEPVNCRSTQNLKMNFLHWSSGKASGLLIFAFFSAPFSFAQNFSYSFDRVSEVWSNQNRLLNPFSGGYNSGQFWPCDLDNDGNDDLIVYDKAAKKCLTFLAKESNGSLNWVYDADFEDILPPIQSWLSTADFNCDGKLDIFTQTSAGIKVYRNVSLFPGQAAFALEVDGLTSQGFNGQVNIQVNPYGAPSFSDVDNDGDLDILTFDFSGNTVEYHRNQVMQSTGLCAGFQLKKDSCVFGLFATHPQCGRIQLNTGCFGQRPSGGGENAFLPSARIQHLGSQLLALDLDGDADKDLLVGDLGCPLLNRLINGGDPDSAIITQADTLFPSSEQYVKLNVFPSAYHLDVNFDGKNDLLVSPTFFNNYQDDFINNTREGTYFYPNQSAGVIPDFQLAGRSFLQNQGIETGEESTPAFADVDADGDQDLFVGHLGLRQGQIMQSSVYFFRNEGSAQVARFALESSDYMGLSSLNVKRIKPLFEDLNADGSLDFGWVSSPGSFEADSTRLRFLINQNPAGQAFSFPGLNQTKLFPFVFSVYDCPVFTDVDGDLAKDMLVGKYAGRIQYWRQTAPWPALQYQLVNSNYGNVSRRPFATNPVLALGDPDQNGKLDLLVGDFTGNLKWYSDFKNQNTSLFIGDSSFFYNELYGQRISHNWGNFVSPAVADLNGDGFPELAVGQTGGGINLLVNRLGPNQVHSTKPISLWSVYPNPLHVGKLLRFSGPKPDRVELYSSLGQQMKDVEIRENEISFPPQQASGLYRLIFHYKTIKQGLAFSYLQND